MTENPSEEQKSSLLSNILAIIGFIIIIVIVIWGLLHIAAISKSWFASLFPGRKSTDNPAVSVSMPATTNPTPEAKPAVKETAGGLPDLNVQILSEGIIDPVSGNIVPRQTTSPSDVVAVRFDIANNGTAPTGAWYFSAELPTLPSYTYTSPAQASLAPGEHIENTLRFAQVPARGGTFTVSVDSSGLVNESNENNNIASQNI